jgi:hypothetical protein
MLYFNPISLHTEYTDSPFYTIPTNQVPILKSLFSMIEKQIIFVGFRVSMIYRN